MIAGFIAMMNTGWLSRLSDEGNSITVQICDEHVDDSFFGYSNVSMKEGIMVDADKIPTRNTCDEMYSLSDGMVLIIDGIVHTLNTTATEIFELCDERNTISEIIDTMKVRYPNDDVTEQVYKCILELNQKSIVSW